MELFEGNDMNIGLWNYGFDSELLLGPFVSALDLATPTPNYDAVASPVNESFITEDSYELPCFSDGGDAPTTPSRPPVQSSLKKHRPPFGRNERLARELEWGVNYRSRPRRRDTPFVYLKATTHPKDRESTEIDPSSKKKKKRKQKTTTTTTAIAVDVAPLLPEVRTLPSSLLTTCAEILPPTLELSVAREMKSEVPLHLKEYILQEKDLVAFILKAAWIQADVVAVTWNSRKIAFRFANVRKIVEMSLNSYNVNERPSLRQHAEAFHKLFVDLPFQPDAFETLTSGECNVKVQKNQMANFRKAAKFLGISF